MNHIALNWSPAVVGSPIVQGVVCQRWNRIVRSGYLGFVGDLAFWDTQGSSGSDL
jgi:hypothetical protein